jgi:hypothetical protein
MAIHWLRNLLLGISSSRLPARRAGRGPRRATFRPALEGLEERQALSAPGLIAPSLVTADAVWYSTGGSTLFHHFGSSPTTLAVSVPHPIVQVSAGKTLFAPSTDAAFLLDNQHNVWEVIRTGQTLSAPQLIATNVARISASVMNPDNVFTISSLDHSLTEYQNWGAFGVESFALGVPGGAGPFQASDLSAGKTAASGIDAVFVNFDGAVYEHRGLTANAGWSFVAGVNLDAPHNYLLTPLAISDLSASAWQSDTVFVLDCFGFLYEDVGQSSGPGTPLSYTSRAVASGVWQVSAGVDSNGNAAAFTLTTSGSLDEYTYQPPSLLQPQGGFAKTHIAGLVSALAAAPTQSNNVCYLVGSFQGVGVLFEHDGQGFTLTHWES